jgi:prolipoprotein diacylglyceryltransferase
MVLLPPAPAFIPRYWLGGMATHGLLIGAAAGTWLFAVAFKAPFLQRADALAIPGAFLMGIGRIGNFIDGQIVGSVTDVWWAVKFLWHIHRRAMAARCWPRASRLCRGVERRHRASAASHATCS